MGERHMLPVGKKSLYYVDHHDPKFPYPSKPLGPLFPVLNSLTWYDRKETYLLISPFDRNYYHRIMAPPPVTLFMTTIAFQPALRQRQGTSISHLQSHLVHVNLLYRVYLTYFAGQEDYV